MFDPPALPGMDDMDQAIAGLNHSGVGEFRPGRILKHERRLPLFAIRGHGHIERAAASGGVVINQQLPSVLERDRIDAGIGVRQCRQAHAPPGAAVVFRPKLENQRLARAGGGLDDNVLALTQRGDGLLLPEVGDGDLIQGREIFELAGKRFH